MKPTSKSQFKRLRASMSPEAQRRSQLRAEQMLNAQDPILKHQEVADLLGISRATLWRLREELPPPIPIGRRTGWRLSTITAWRAARERKP